MRRRKLSLPRERTQRRLFDQVRDWLGSAAKAHDFMLGIGLQVERER